MTEKEKMLSGKLYSTHDDELKNDSRRAQKLTRLLNMTTEEDRDIREELYKKLFFSVGEGCHIEPPFRCDYGCHIRIGNHFYANYDCIIIDVCDVTIGDYVFFAPRVGVYTAEHPIAASVRNTGLESGRPICIGDHVWIGAHTVINPGVNIGSDVVIGSGSVVTKDIPDHVVAVGNPCRVLRKITDEDRKYWEEKQREWEEDR